MTTQDAWMQMKARCDICPHKWRVVTPVKFRSTFVPSSYIKGVLVREEKIVVNASLPAPFECPNCSNMSGWPDVDDE